MSNTQAVNAIIFRFQQQVDDLKMQLIESDKKFKMENRDHLFCRNLIDELEKQLAAKDTQLKIAREALKDISQMGVDTRMQTVSKRVLEALKQMGGGE